MLIQAAKEHDLDLKKSWMIGDRMSDVEAGRRAGTRSILLQNQTTPPIDGGFNVAEFISLNVLEAAKFIISRDKI
jgi:D-sedoheptulose 7-phosphate isomerase